MPKINAEIPESLGAVLDEEIGRTRTDASSIIAAVLAQYLRMPIHTLFQVSTSGALVAGVYAGAVRAQGLLEHGDFGLGSLCKS
jgi:acetolactate decarboxylase